MRERVVPDQMSFVINPLCDSRKLVGLNANQKEGRPGILFLEDIENLRSPLWVGTIVERDRDFIRTIPVSADAIWFGHGLKDLVIDHLAVGINADVADAMSRLVFDAEDFSLTFHVNVGAGRYVTQLFGCARIAGHVPYAPQRPVLTAQPPQCEGLDPQGLCGSHLIQSRNSVDEPYVVTEITLIQIAEVRIHRIVIKVDVLIRVTRF